MKIHIVTDMEGVTGVYDFDNHCTESGRYWEKARRLLTLEVNAACEGFFEGGADEVQVVIGHHFESIDRELLDRRAVLLNGRGDRLYPNGLDDNCDALAFVGQHAKAGTSYAHLAHTGNIYTTDQRINALSIGEYGATALCAMELGIPTIFASGDRALAEEAEALTPGVVTVYGKWGRCSDNGVSQSMDVKTYENYNLASVQLSPEVVREKIRAGAKAAVEKLLREPESFHYPDIKPPYYLVREHRANNGNQPFALIAERNTIAECFIFIYLAENPRVSLDKVKM